MTTLRPPLRSEGVDDSKESSYTGRSACRSRAARSAGGRGRTRRHLIPTARAVQGGVEEVHPFPSPSRSRSRPTPRPARSSGTQLSGCSSVGQAKACPTRPHRTLHPSMYRSRAARSAGGRGRTRRPWLLPAPATQGSGGGPPTSPPSRSRSLRLTGDDRDGRAARRSVLRHAGGTERTKSAGVQVPFLCLAEAPTERQPSAPARSSPGAGEGMTPRKEKESSVSVFRADRGRPLRTVRGTGNPPPPPVPDRRRDCQRPPSDGTLRALRWGGETTCGAGPAGRVRQDRRRGEGRPASCGGRGAWCRGGRAPGRAAVPTRHRPGRGRTAA